MRYDKWRFIFPPRPRNAISPDDLNFWDNGTLICQCKLNGSNATIYTDGKKVVVMNRHGQRLTNFRLIDEEVKSIYRGDGGWLILNGEYLNKNKMDETGQSFNHKFVIFDILCYDGDYLVGKTFEERVNLLDILYDKNESEKEYLYSISTNVYRVKSYRNGFKDFFDKFTPIDIIEGVVLKRSNARLEVGASEQNNVKSQIKCRKATKNYKY